MRRASRSALALLWVLVTAAAEAAVLTRGPYLQLGTPTSIVVRWRTDAATDSRVLFGAQPGALSSAVLDPTGTTEHVVTLTGLSPATTYYYAVGTSTEVLAGDDADHVFVTAPPDGTSGPIRIWVLGDSGTGNQDALAVRDAYLAYTGQRRTDLWLMLGDNAYPSGTDAEYQTKLFDIYPMMLRRSVLWPTLGNHDGVSADSATQSGPYYDIFSLPTAAQAGGLASGTEAYYSFDFANIHFVVLDSFETDRASGGAMLTWLDQDLDATLQDWIIAFWHHPPYSKGSHDSDTEIELVEMRENALPILDAHGVDLTLTGHSHSYERSFLIDGHYGDSSTFDPSMVVDGGDGSVGGDGPYTKSALGGIPHAGIVHTVAGSSGQISGGSLDHPAMLVSLNVLGSLVLDIDGNRLDAAFLDQAGAVRDSFTIIKGCPEYGEFGSLNPGGASGSPVLTPGYCDAGPPCGSDIGSSVSSSFAGAFWMMGSGNPAVGAGVDNGAFPALEGPAGGWVHHAPLAPAFVQGSWAADARVDGCVGDVPEPRCMAMMLGDQRAGIGYFALLSAAAGPSNEFSFVQPSEAPIALATIPRPAITATQLINPYTLIVSSVVRSVPPGGLYLDAPQCSTGAVVGYRIYQQITTRGGPAPVDRTRDDGNPQTGWEVADGGAGPSGEPLPINSPTQVRVTCYTASDLFLATSYVFESGFETPFVSFNAPRILCGNCAQDNDQDGSCALWLSGASGPDCDDGNAHVYPGAPQLCGDGLNNDCAHPSWPSLVNTNEHDDDGDTRDECSGDCNDANASVWAVPGESGEVLSLPGHETIAWTGPGQPGGTLSSVVYDTLRSATPNGFDTATCIESDDGADTLASDPQAPGPGLVFYYLVRAGNACGSGTLGSGAGGIERSGRACP